MPLSKTLLKPRLCEYSHSRFTILNAMSWYGGPALKRMMQKSGELVFSKKNRGAACLSIRSG
uniref:Uncharacterized protein n=1 Tax=Globisporangium ultimum (strain ATCC 200006 / CBS 805.95 / DAOM BR144) TaxID=431595 RepID=K3X2U1_GLOUD